MPTSYEQDLMTTQSGSKTVVYQAPPDSEGVSPPPDITTQTLVPVTGWTRAIRQKDWERTPNYRQKRESGTLPMNLYWRQQFTRVNATLAHNSVVGFGPPGGYVRTNSREEVALNYPGSGALSSAWGPLANKLLEKARSREWSLPVFVGEARQTVALVTHTARRLNGVVRELRRGNIVGAYRYLSSNPDTLSRSATRRFNRSWGTRPHDAAANAWMEARYAWRPLLSDVRDAAEALALSVQQPGAGDFTIRASHSDTVTDTSPDTYATSALGVGYAYRIVTLQSTKARAVWRVGRSPGWQPAWFGLDNPLEVAWELIPLSFVADWFLPIGDYVSALSLSYPVSHKEYGIGLMVDNEFRYVPVMTNHNTSFSGGVTSYKAWRFIPQGSPPSASLFVSPQINFNWSKAVDSLILLRQGLRSFGRG